MKILIFGRHDSSNLGDGVICECVAGLIRKNFTDAELSMADLMDRLPRETRKQQEQRVELSKKRMLRLWIRERIRIFATKYTPWDRQYKSAQSQFREIQSHLEEVCRSEFDLAVFAGGQMFQDFYALRDRYVVEAAGERGKSVIFNACGSGPFYSPKLRSCMAQTLKAPNVAAASMRDSVQWTNERLGLIGTDRCVEDTFDPALCCAEHYQVGKEQDAKTVGLGVMWSGCIPPFAARRFWHRLIRKLEKKHIPWKIFTNGHAGDMEFARWVIGTMDGSERSFEQCVVSAPEDPEQLVRTVSQFKSIVSFRLHSHIIAASLDVPSVAVVWDDKVRQFFAKIGCPERCCTVWTGPDKVLARLETAERNGYDRARIEEQRSFSEEWLIRAIRGVESL